MQNIIKKQWFYTNCNVVSILLGCVVVSKSIRFTMFRDTIIIIIISSSTVWSFSWSFFMDVRTLKIRPLAVSKRLEPNTVWRSVTYQQQGYVPSPTLKLANCQVFVNPIDIEDQRLYCLRTVILLETYSSRPLWSNMCHLCSVSQQPNIATPQFRQGMCKECELTRRTVSIAFQYRDL
jgi:hypothetical protein